MIQEPVATDTVFRTVVDTVVQVVSDTVFVGTTVSTWTPLVPAAISAIATIVIARFAWVTLDRGNKDRIERTEATDARISVEAHEVRTLILGWTTQYDPQKGDTSHAARSRPSKGDPLHWATEFKKYDGDVRTGIRALVEQAPKASRTVSEAVREAYVLFNCTIDRVTNGLKEQHPQLQKDYVDSAWESLRGCAEKLSLIVDEDLKKTVKFIRASDYGRSFGTATVEAEPPPEEDVPQPEAGKAE